MTIQKGDEAITDKLNKDFQMIEMKSVESKPLIYRAYYKYWFNFKHFCWQKPERHGYKLSYPESAFIRLTSLITAPIMLALNAIFLASNIASMIFGLISYAVTGNAGVLSISAGNVLIGLRNIMYIPIDLFLISMSTIAQSVNDQKKNTSSFANVPCINNFYIGFRSLKKAAKGADCSRLIAQSVDENEIYNGKPVTIVCEVYKGDKKDRVELKVYESQWDAELEVNVMNKKAMHSVTLTSQNIQETDPETVKYVAKYIPKSVKKGDANLPDEIFEGISNDVVQQSSSSCYKCASSAKQK